MAEVTAATVKELRERTGAGMMDCKKALGETGGDMEAAIDWLRTKGLAAAAKKAGRTAASLTRDLLAFSRKQVLQPVVLDLNAVIDSTGTLHTIATQ